MKTFVQTGGDHGEFRISKYLVDKKNLSLLGDGSDHNSDERTGGPII